jgi:hypothetical protein
MTPAPSFPTAYPALPTPSRNPMNAWSMPMSFSMAGAAGMTICECGHLSSIREVTFLSKDHILGFRALILIRGNHR